MEIMIICTTRSKGPGLGGHIYAVAKVQVHGPDPFPEAPEFVFYLIVILLQYCRNYFTHYFSLIVSLVLLLLLNFNFIYLRQPADVALGGAVWGFEPQVYRLQHRFFCQIPRAQGQNI